MCIFNSHFSCQITFHGSCSSLPTNNTAWQVLNQLGPNCPLWPLLMLCLGGPVPFGLAVLCHVQCCSETDIAEASQRMGTCLPSTCKHYSALHWALKCISDSGKQDVWRKNYTIEKQQLLCQLSGQHVLCAVNLAPEERLRG